MSTRSPARPAKMRAAVAAVPRPSGAATRRSRRRASPARARAHGPRCDGAPATAPFLGGKQVRGQGWRGLDKTYRRSRAFFARSSELLVVVGRSISWCSSRSTASESTSAGSLALSAPEGSAAAGPHQAGASAAAAVTAALGRLVVTATARCHRVSPSPSPRLPVADLTLVSRRRQRCRRRRHRRRRLPPPVSRGTFRSRSAWPSALSPRLGRLRVAALVSALHVFLPDCTRADAGDLRRFGAVGRRLGCRAGSAIVPRGALRLVAAVAQ